MVFGADTAPARLELQCLASFQARMGVNPLTREAMQFAGKPASKSVTAPPLKVGKDAVFGFKEGTR
ncbi:hypothetical protein XH87_09025 [Bradyrhizobium sp. CCBAU 53415]|nr:hypothetical protein [Bradyrhizobium sp. CCBAU 53415]